MLFRSVAFYAEQIARAKRDGVLFSLHLKATMMKVSDPILFGHAVRVYFAELLNKHAATFATLGVDLNNGFGDLVEKLQQLPADQRAAIEADIKAAQSRPNAPSPRPASPRRPDLPARGRCRPRWRPVDAQPR